MAASGVANVSGCKVRDHDGNGIKAGKVGSDDQSSPQVSVASSAPAAEDIDVKASASSRKRKSLLVDPPKRLERPAAALARSDDDAVLLKVVMPDVDKKRAKVQLRAEQNNLVIQVKGDKDLADNRNDPLRYPIRVDLTIRIQLPFSAEVLKMDQFSAEMKNGLLNITVPRVKEEK